MNGNVWLWFGLGMMAFGVGFMLSLVRMRRRLQRRVNEVVAEEVSRRVQQRILEELRGGAGVKRVSSDQDDQGDD